MRLPDFELEVFFGRYEFSTPYLLAQSDCESLSIDALLALEPDPEKARHEFLQTRLGYSPNDGSPALRQAVSRLYRRMTEKDVLLFTGAQEGIFACMNGVAPISTGHPSNSGGGAGTMAGTSAKTSSTVEIVNITPRRRWSVGEKVRLIEASMAPGQSVSLVARTYGVAPNLLYRWRKQMSEGGKTAIEANDEVVSVAEVKALKKRIRQLERVLGNKTLEVEILKEAVRIGREKKLISRLPLSGVEDFQ